MFKTNHLPVGALILLTAHPHKHQGHAFTLFAFLCALLHGQLVPVCTYSVLPCIFVCLSTTNSSVGSLTVSSIERVSYGARGIITSWLGNWGRDSLSSSLLPPLLFCHSVGDCSGASLYLVSCGQRAFPGGSFFSLSSIM